MDYNKTINLPKTSFPMRAGLPKREPEMLRRWEDEDIYNELLKKNEGKPLFSLHDGPPFSNGSIHMGTAMNKALKDIITRSYAMRGYCTPYIPGWDNHGMPIESAIIKQNKLDRKAMSVPEFRSACRDFAKHYVGVQMEAFKRIGVVGDWEHPYLTMDPGFEAEEVKVFGEMYKKGYIYKGLKPVYWCPHDETALAEAEIEYKDDPCTTVYVKFPMHDDLGKLSSFDKSRLFFVIWTTTIWTLPGNLAIALHPNESYAVVKASNGDCFIMAEALTEKVMGLGGFESWEIAGTHPGSFFENMLADHPFLPKTFPAAAGGLRHHGFRYRLRPHGPRLRRGRLSDLQALRDGNGGSRGRPGQAYGLRREVRGNVRREVQSRDSERHEGKRDALRVGGHHSQLPPLLALQESHHLPRHAPMVLLCGILQGRSLRRCRRGPLGAEMGH